jgi:hypothetical protein
MVQESIPDGTHAATEHADVEHTTEATKIQSDGLRGETSSPSAEHVDATTEAEKIQSDGIA